MTVPRNHVQGTQLGLNDSMQLLLRQYGLFERITESGLHATNHHAIAAFSMMLVSKHRLVIEPALRDQAALWGVLNAL